MQNKEKRPAVSNIETWHEAERNKLVDNILYNINKSDRQAEGKQILIGNLLFQSIDIAVAYYNKPEYEKTFENFRDVIKKRIRRARREGTITLEKLEEIFTKASPNRFAEDYTVNGIKYDSFAKICEAFGLSRQGMRKKYNLATKRKVMSYHTFFNLSHDEYKQILKLPLLQD